MSNGGPPIKLRKLNCRSQYPKNGSCTPLQCPQNRHVVSCWTQPRRGASAQSQAQGLQFEGVNLVAYWKALTLPGSDRWSFRFCMGHMKASSLKCQPAPTAGMHAVMACAASCVVIQRSGVCCLQKVRPCMTQTHLQRPLAGDDGLHEEAEHGEHRQPPVLQLLHLRPASRSTQSALVSGPRRSPRSPGCASPPQMHV